jgi:hypothetical protein
MNIAKQEIIKEYKKQHGVELTEDFKIVDSKQVNYWGETGREYTILPEGRIAEVIYIKDK